jgi:hypothetical protein
MISINRSNIRQYISHQLEADFNMAVVEEVNRRKPKIDKVLIGAMAFANQKLSDGNVYNVYLEYHAENVFGFLYDGRVHYFAIFQTDEFPDEILDRFNNLKHELECSKK